MSASKHGKNSEKSIPSFVHLALRFFYTMMAWFLLGNGISPTSFFAGLFLFAIPVLTDCCQFYVDGWSKKFIIVIEIVICGLWVCFSLLGLFGILVVVPSNGTFFITTSNTFIGFDLPAIPLPLIWKFLSSITLITAIDFASREIMRRKGDRP